MAAEAELSLVQELFSCLLAGEECNAIDFFRVNPGLIRYPDGHWLQEAARYGMVNLTDFLIEAGHDINDTSGFGNRTPLDIAVASDRIPDRTTFVIAMLNRGADPNISRPLITALIPRAGEEDFCLEMVRVLVEIGGADVNRVYDIYGDPNNTFTAVEWAEAYGRHKIAAYLRSKGAIDRAPQPIVPPPSAKKKRKSS